MTARTPPHAQPPEFLGQGTYGCVFSPPPDCLGSSPPPALPQKKNKAYIAKVFFDKSELQDELKIYTDIMEAVDPRHTFTPRVFVSCVTDQASVPRNQKKQCAHDIQGKYQLILENRGMDGKQLLASPALEKTKMAVFFRNASVVAEGVRRMHEKNIVHHDIKPANLLFDPKKPHRVTLIDFGVATPKSSVYNVDRREFHCHEYLFYPPEYAFICALRTTGSVRQHSPNKKTVARNTPFDRFITKVLPHGIPIENTQVFTHLTRTLAAEISAAELRDLLYGFRHTPRTHAFREFLRVWDAKYAELGQKFPRKTHADLVRDTIKRLHLENYVDVYMMGVTLAYMFFMGVEREMKTATDVMHLKKHARMYVHLLRIMVQSTHANAYQRMSIHALAGALRACAS